MSALMHNRKMEETSGPATDRELPALSKEAKTPEFTSLEPTRDQARENKHDYRKSSKAEVLEIHDASKPPFTPATLRSGEADLGNKRRMSKTSQVHPLSSPTSPLGNGRDVYGNYLSTPPKNYFCSGQHAESPASAPRQAGEALIDLMMKFSAQSGDAVREVCREDEGRFEMRLRGGWGNPWPFGDGFTNNAQHANADSYYDESSYSQEAQARQKDQLAGQKTTHYTLDAPSLYTSASQSYMRGQQSRTPTPPRKHPNRASPPRVGQLQVPTSRGMRPLTNEFTSYGRVDVPSRSKPLSPPTSPPSPFNTPYSPTDPDNPSNNPAASARVDALLIETKRRIANTNSFVPEKSYHFFGPPELPDAGDNASILSADDRFKDLEGLHDSGPYTKQKQQRMYHVIMKERAKTLEAERRKQRERKVREGLGGTGVWNYGVEASVVPGDSISQVGIARKKGVGGRDVREQGGEARGIGRGRAFPRPLTAPMGSVVAGPTSTMVNGRLASTPLDRTSIGSKISRFLLSAPSDPGLKTYSNRVPPADSAVARARNEARSTLPPRNATPAAAPQTRDFAHGNQPRNTIRAPITPTIDGSTLLPSTPSSSKPAPPIPLLKKPSLLLSTIRRKPSTTIDKNTISAPVPFTHKVPQQVPTLTPVAVLASRLEELGAGDGESAVTAWPEEDEGGVVKVGRMGRGGRLRGG